MSNRTRLGIAALLAGAALVAGCGAGKSDPGPLAGTWRTSGPVVMTIAYRPGESEAMGVIEKVSYEIKGNQVLVKTESGPMAGVAMRIQLVDANTAQSDGLGVMRRVR